MNKNSKGLFLVITGALLFNLVFWQEKLALNAILFDVFLLSSLFCLYKDAGQQITVRWLLLGHLLCLAMVVLHNTELSKIAFCITGLLIAGFAAYQHRSAWFAGGSILMNIVLFIASFFEQFRYAGKPRRRRGRIKKLILLAVFPVLLLGVFFVIYQLANSVFSAMARELEEKLAHLTDYFLQFFSWRRFLFLLAGLYITGVVLLRSRVNYFVNREQQYRDDLLRGKGLRSKPKRTVLESLIAGLMGRFANGMLALKNENTVGMISLLLLNALLLVINGIDISYLWLHFDFMGNVNLTQMVHEGAELLILSIVLAMMVVLFFFKGNLNFYQKNKWLKAGAYAWIVQNGVLVVSVFLRDYYYIARFGLAYKRIGVLFFLLMVLIGLVTVMLKIYYRKTGYYLFRVNAWAGIVVLVLSTTVHWDELIAGYNLSRRDRIKPDIPFLLTLSDKTLPLLDQYKTVLAQYEKASPPLPGERYRDHCDTCFIERLQAREQRFLEEQQLLSWLSWNYSDAYTGKYFRHRPLTHISAIIKP